MVLAQLLVLLICSLKLMFELLDLIVVLVGVFRLSQLASQVLDLVRVPIIVTLKSHRLVALLLDSAVCAL